MEIGRRRTMRRSACLVLVLALILIQAACTADTGQTATPAAASHIELDIFSGRPNPTWELSVADTATLIGMIDSLQPSPPVDLPTPLGYRGFLVNVDEPESGSVARIRAYQGIVEYRSRETKYYADLDKQVERWLLATARTYIDSQLYDSLLIEIETGK
jgi:hypothetical protein